MLHDAILEALFGPTFSNDEVGLFLVRIGWIYTFSVSIIMMWMAAPYGKHMGDGILSWGKISAKLGWIVQEIPAFIVPSYFLYEKFDVCTLTQINLLGMFILHYANRSFLFPLQIKGGRDMPLSTVLSAFLFTSFNGFIQAHYILYVVDFGDLNSEVFRPNFVIGTAVFLLGMFINMDSDRRLRMLRSPEDKKSEDSKSSGGRYKIPYGGMFDYVSSANYFGEIVEWWGYAIAARFTPAALLFAGFTTMFLGMRGVHNHRWYKEKFGQRYPVMRRAIFPLIW